MPDREEKNQNEAATAVEPPPDPAVKAAQDEAGPVKAQADKGTGKKAMLPYFPGCG